MASKKNAIKRAKAKVGGKAPSGSEYSTGDFGKGRLTDRGKKPARAPKPVRGGA